jgi:Flp pilus assembly pilin Flp
MSPRLRSCSGPSSIEYVAILAIVAIVMAATVAGGAIFAPGIANAVVGKFRHGLCVVAGRACVELAERPCVVRSTRDARRETLSVAFFQLGSGRVVLREKLSDGRVRLTLLRQFRGGVTAAAGGTANVKIGKVRIRAATHAEATLAAIVGRGLVYEAAGDREADALMEQLRVSGSPSWDLARHVLGGEDGQPQPYATTVELGAEGEASGTLSRDQLSGGAGADAEAAIGRRFDRRTGEQTFYFRLQAGLSVFGDAMLAKASAGAEGDAILSLTLDRNGHPKELSALVGGHGEVQIGTAGDLATAIGEHTARAETGRWEAEARVSLTDPDTLAAFSAWRRNPRSTEAVRHLGETLYERARVDVRKYTRAATSDSDGAGASLGVRIGVEVDRDTEARQLAMALTRPPGGLWERRLDCVR